MAATMRRVAEQAGVSLQTVSRYINQSGPVSAAAARRIAQAIDELDFQPSAIARNLRRRRSGLIGLAVSNILNMATAGLARAAQDVAEAHGYAVITSNTDESIRGEEEVFSYFARSKVEGVFCSPVSRESGQSIRRYLAGIPIVCSRLMDGFDCVASDGQGGVAAAVRLHLQHGHRLIGLITLPADTPTGGLRLAGYRQALAEGGIAYDERCVIALPTGTWVAHRAESPPAHGGSRPTAIVIAHALAAPSVLRSIRQQGLQIPADMSVITVEENVWAPVVDPPLTTISSDVRAIGSQGMELVMRRIGGDRSDAPRHILTPMTLRIRSSAAPHGSPPPAYDQALDLPLPHP